LRVLLNGVLEKVASAVVFFGEVAVHCVVDTVSLLVALCRQKRCQLLKSYFGSPDFARVPIGAASFRPEARGEIHLPKTSRYRRVDALERAKVRRHAGSQNLSSVRRKNRDDRYRRNQPESADCAIIATGATLSE
jgi:hypothetical protein